MEASFLMVIIYLTLFFMCSSAGQVSISVSASKDHENKIIKMTVLHAQREEDDGKTAVDSKK